VVVPAIARDGVRTEPPLWTVVTGLFASDRTNA
jgi:hypothetical protein